MRSVLEVWSDLIIGGEAPLGLSLMSDVMGKADVTQLSREGIPVRTYVLEELYPTNIQSQDRAYNKCNEIGEFTYHFWTVLDRDGRQKQ